MDGSLTPVFIVPMTTGLIYCPNDDEFIFYTRCLIHKVVVVEE
jgi:hypothetical protein